MEKDFEKWIRKQVNRYVPHLGLELWDIKIEKTTKERYLAMSCNYPYMDGRIMYTDAALKDWKEKKLMPDRILHELCHLITDPLYVKAVERHSSVDEIKDERERLTDYLAATLRKLI